MTPYARIRLEGAVRIALAPPDAFHLFTPSGERAWAQGWDPWFPAPAADETQPGTVFQTHHHHATTWVVAARDPHRSITYSNVAGNDRASLIHVSCEPDAAGGTIARVSYDVTALSDEGAAWLDEFAAGYQEFLGQWQDDIAAALAR